MDFINWDAIKEKVKETTKEYNEAINPSTPLSDKAKLINEIIISGDFGCRTSYIKKLVSLLIDEKLPIIDNRLGNFTMVSSLNNIPSIKNNEGEIKHGYGVDEPILMLREGYGAQYGFKANGEWGLEVLQQETRPSTMEEIDKFFDQLTERGKASLVHKLQGMNVFS